MFNKLFTHFTRVILSACIIAMMAVAPGFAANSVSITFDLAGGVLPDGSTSYTYESDGTNMVVLDNPTKDGFIFRGWCTQAAIDGNQCVPEYISDESDGAFVRWIIPATVAANTTYVAQWTPDKFQITTRNLSSDTDVGFILTAAGQFYVDWGDGDVEYIERATTDIEDIIYTHTYEDSGVYTIHFGGLATEYRYFDPTEPQSSMMDTFASMMGTVAINFGMGYLPGGASLSAYIASVSGSLGAIFPTLNNGANLSDNPAFIGTFAVSPYLRSVPADLFSGVTKASAAMFAMTFGVLNIENGDTEEGLCGLTSIPSGLFSGVNGSAYGMFAGTFAGCPITSIPSGLFRKVTTAQDMMFAGTFAGCTDLGTNQSIAEPIPQNLFSTVTGGAAQLFRATFMGCSGLTHIPENLFSGVNVLAERIFQGTFAQCTDLRSLPDSLFPNVTSFPPYASERSLFPFSGMFMGDSNLTGFVPQTLFANLSSANYRKYDMRAIFEDTNLKSDCAEIGMVNDETPFQADWYVKDEQYATTCRNARITYELNGGTNSSLNPTEYTFDDLLITLAKPTKAGSSFLGWCANDAPVPEECDLVVTDIDSNLINYFAKSPAPTSLVADIRVYAMWAYDASAECFQGEYAQFDFVYSKSEEDRITVTATCKTCPDNYCCPGGTLYLRNAVSYEDNDEEVLVSGLYQTTDPSCNLQPVSCSEGQYAKLTPAETATTAATLTCEPCEEDYYCPGGIWIANEVGSDNTAGREHCPAGYTSEEGSSAITECYATCPTGDDIPCVTGANCSYPETTSTTPVIKYYGDACPTQATCQTGYSTADVAEWITNHIEEGVLTRIDACSLGGIGVTMAPGADQSTGVCAAGLSLGQWRILASDDAPLSQMRGVVSCNNIAPTGVGDEPDPVYTGSEKIVPTVTGRYCWVKPTHIDNMEIDVPWTIGDTRFKDSEDCARNCFFGTGQFIQALVGTNICEPKKVDIKWGGVAEPGEAASCMYDTTLVLPDTAPIPEPPFDDTAHYRFKGWKVGTPDGIEE